MLLKVSTPVPLISGRNRGIIPSSISSLWSRAPKQQNPAIELEDFKSAPALIHQLLPPNAPDFLKAAQSVIVQSAQTGGRIPEDMLASQIADTMHGYYRFLEAAATLDNRVTKAAVRGLWVHAAAATVAALSFEIMTAGLAFQPFISQNRLGYPLLITQAALMTALIKWNKGLIRGMYVASSIAFATILGYGASQNPAVSALGQYFHLVTSDDSLDPRTYEQLVKVQAQLPALKNKVADLKEAVEQARKTDATVRGSANAINRKTTFGRTSAQYQTASNELSNMIGQEAQLKTKMEAAQTADPSRENVKHYAWILFVLLNAASTMWYARVLSEAEPAHEAALGRKQRKKLLAEEIKALRENATKREALASKFLVGLRTLYVNTLASDGKKAEASRNADEIFGDIHTLSQKAAQAFKDMLANNPQTETAAESHEPNKKPVPVALTTRRAPA
jgi:hypothetical protein